MTQRSRNPDADRSTQTLEGRLFTGSQQSRFCSEEFLSSSRFLNPKKFCWSYYSWHFCVALNGTLMSQNCWGTSSKLFPLFWQDFVQSRSGCGLAHGDQGARVCCIWVPCGPDHWEPLANPVAEAVGTGKQSIAMLVAQVSYLQSLDTLILNCYVHYFDFSDHWSILIIVILGMSILKLKIPKKSFESFSCWKKVNFKHVLGGLCSELPKFIGESWFPKPSRIEQSMSKRSSGIVGSMAG